IGRRIGLDEVAWKERCSQVLQFVKKAEKKVKKLEEPSRDPFEPIEAILGLDNPLQAIADAVRRMDVSRPSTSGTAEAVWARDRLLLALTASNPLRAENLRSLTYREDNTGHLRQDARGCWRIRIG